MLTHPVLLVLQALFQLQPEEASFISCYCFWWYMNIFPVIMCPGEFSARLCLIFFFCGGFFFFLVWGATQGIPIPDSILWWKKLLHYFYEIVPEIVFLSSVLWSSVLFFLFVRNFLIFVVSNKKVTMPVPQFYFSETEQNELRFGMEFWSGSESQLGVRIRNDSHGLQPFCIPAEICVFYLFSVYFLLPYVALGLIYTLW